MKKYDAFVTTVNVEHTVVEAESEKEAKEKVRNILFRISDVGIADPAEFIDAQIEIRPIEANRLTLR